MNSFTPTSSPGTDSPDTAGSPADRPRGTTVINDAVVAKIAGLALRDVAGIHAVGGGAARAFGAIRDAISSTDHGQGVSVEVGESQVTVDLSIVAGYPVPLQQVAEDARAAIIEAIETLVGLQVTEVNVTINDVHLPDEADDTDKADVQ
jgi:uncharacterized alkaline shock family protein YloU